MNYLVNYVKDYNVVLQQKKDNLNYLRCKYVTTVKNCTVTKREIFCNNIEFVVPNLLEFKL